MRKPQRKLSKESLEHLLGKKRLDAMSLKALGAVMLTADVASGRRRPNIMFREQPDPKLPFSGWVFLSGDEAPPAFSAIRGLELCDPLAILRVAPEVAAYLDMPLGTRLVRTGKTTFEPLE